jgi:uncharacterized protein YbbC (DUF1343 family)/CubicO group peptidase (beta-lactamase class C family)
MHIEGSRVPHAMRALRSALALTLAAALGCTRATPPAPEDAAPSPAEAISASAPTAIPEPSAVLSAPPPGDAAAPLPSTATTAATIDEAANGAVARGDVPGAVIAVVRSGGVVSLGAYGLRSKEPEEQPMTVDTVFDLASLTKAVATAPSIHLLAEQGKLQLSAPVARYLPAFGRNGKEAITVEQLLLHTSGLVADNALADYRGGRAAAFARIDALTPAHDPGAAFDYSDVGYIVLGELVEAVSGEPLDVFAREHLFAPLGMADTAFEPGPALRARAAPTEPVDGGMLAGEVHDPRARLLGGVAGNAGLFSTAADLARFAEMLLGKGRRGAAQVLAPATLRAMVEPHELPGGVSRSLGWDVRSGFSGARGDLGGGYGHTGFTGTSMWIDPGSDTAIIVLTSRLHPDGKGDPRRLRREVAAVVARGFHAGGAETPPTPPNGSPRGAPAGKALAGIDVLERDGFARLRGRHVGLITNASGVDRSGARTADLLHAAPGVRLVALFSPEHGLGGGADGSVSDGRDERTGLPVLSLYGKRTRPTAAELHGVDMLVFDLADAGARSFTYETTLGYMIEAAAENHLPLVVLDRPDPIGGTAVEGPVLEPGRTSFVGYHPLPVRHGMTLGELALLFNRERAIGADLEVVRVEGWHRGELFDATGLPWVNPSPNLRSVDAALLYPGLALLEATNVSVGRGTARPFEQIGAPWVDGGRLAAALAELRLPGVRFTATSFTPASSAFAGERCEGVLLRIEDRGRFEPVRAGISVAATLRRLYPEAWEAKNVLTLLGDQATFAALLRGASPDAMVSGWQPGLRAFLPVRKKYLLYLE